MSMFKIFSKKTVETATPAPQEEPQKDEAPQPTGKPKEGTFRIRVNGKVVYEGPSGSVKIDQGNSGSMSVSNVSSRGSISIVNGVSSSNGVEVIVEGDVHGDVDAGMSVTCGNVGGSVDAGMSVTCKDVSGDVDAGMNINAAVIQGDADAGMNVNVGKRG